MNDSMFQSEFRSEPAESSSPGNHSSADDVPQFGAVDIVEAFTAMRHEWRGQSKESRLLVEQIQTAVTHIQFLESKLLAGIADARKEDNGSGDKVEIKPLVLLLTDTDHQLSRAISAIDQWESTRRQQAEIDWKSVEQYFASMNAVARWFARPLLMFIAGQRTVPAASAENNAVEGLNLILARLRDTMKEHGIERLETLGQAFEPETMHAIGTMETTDYPAGYVAEQLSPGYFWQGQVLRFANVRVAR